jgi:SAM-dependent methyltransferase
MEHERPEVTEPLAPDCERSRVSPRRSRFDRQYFEDIFATGPDPWRYTSRYEQKKYEQTLSLLPKRPIESALEIGCAEGHFTVQLAPHVKKLTAADISEAALERAAVRCAACGNVRFLNIDLFEDQLPGRFQLIVCSELLYFASDHAELLRTGIKLAQGLRTGGYLVCAHANLVADEPEQPGFDWDVPFGAKVVGDALAATPGLHLDRELRTPLYRIQRFRRPHAEATPKPAILEFASHASPDPHLAARILWMGGTPRRDRATVVNRG